MANEGEFPKIDGDILYASEVNTFNPKFIGVLNPNSTFTVNSGTDFTTYGGSILYPGAGSHQISYFLDIRTNYSIIEDAVFSARLLVSGPGITGLPLAQKDNASNSREWGRFVNVILTSGLLTTSGGNIGSPYIISLQYKTNNAGGYTNQPDSDLVVIGF